MRKILTRIYVAVLTSIVLVAVGVVARAQYVNGFATLMDGGPIASQSCSANCNNTALLGPIDTTGYNFISLQVTNIGGGATLAFQQSDDNPCSAATNWQTSSGMADNYNTAAGGANAAFGTGLYILSVKAHCFRLEFTAYTSGTITAEGYLRNVGPPSVGINGGIVGAAVGAYPGVPNSANIASPVSCGATGSTAAVTCTLAGAAGKTTYICGFDIEAVGGTAAVTPAVATLIGTVTMTYTLNSSATGVFLSREFAPCIPTTAVNTAITVTSTADGTATAVDVNAHGYQL